MRSLILALLVGAGLACDPCSSMARVHMERCNTGDTASCEWLQVNNVGPAGICLAD
jgi:hypothetical protein